MSQPLLVKLYGNLYPATESMEVSFKHLCRDAFPVEAAKACISLQKDLLLISFEGIYFPKEELEAWIYSILQPNLCGKIDFLDLENWQMTRYLVTDGQLNIHTVSLNHVMDYSGF